MDFCIHRLPPHGRAYSKRLAKGVYLTAMIKKHHLLVLMAIGLTSPCFSQGFLKKLQKKAEAAATDLIIKKSTQKAEKAMEEKKQEESTSTSSSLKQTEEPASGSTREVKSYSKYDFVPGASILFTENFEQDQIGEFPLKWFTNGSGEVVTLEGFAGKWVKMSSGALLSPTFKFPENFTYEFDVFMDIDPATRYVRPALGFELFDRGNKATKVGYNAYTIKNMLKFSAGLHADNAIVTLDSRQNALVKLQSEKVKLPGFQTNYRNVVHVAIAVQKERLRLWMNADKIFDLPIAVASPHNFNQLLVWGAKTKEGSPAFYYTNFRVAAGLADTRTKLLSEGRYSTSGILFDSNSDHIKPESTGLMREIAAALKENGNVKFTIIGHTDNQGNDADNLVLSKKRAEAVKKSLIEEYGVEASLLQTQGKGAVQPIAENNTLTGRMQNRRVEFIKISQ